MVSWLPYEIGWLEFIPLAGVILVSLKSALIYRLYGTRFTYWTGGYLFDGKRRMASKLFLFLVNTIAGYLLVYLLFLIE